MRRALLMRWLCFPILLSLSACAVHKLEELRYVEPSGTPFQRALSAEYRRLSEREQQRYNWNYAVYFAERALDAAYGQNVAPELVENIVASQEAIADLRSAREQLLAVLTEDNQDNRPQSLAETQSAFDFWVIEQRKKERHWVVESSFDAREQFQMVLLEVLPVPEPEPIPVKKAKTTKKLLKNTGSQSSKNNQKKSKPSAKKSTKTVKTTVKSVPKKAEINKWLVPAHDEVSKKQAEKPIAPLAEETMEALLAQEALAREEPESASYMVLFSPGQAELTPAARKVIDNAAKSVLPLVSYRIAIKSEAEVESLAVDPVLADARITAIKKHLIMAEVPESVIDISAMDDAKSSSPVAPVPMGVKRKVEIFVSE